MTAEQEAIERLRFAIDEALPQFNFQRADLRALLASHERMRAALAELQDAVQGVCEQGHVTLDGLELLGSALGDADLALEGENE